MSEEDIKRMLSEHRQNFDEFHDDWLTHRSEAKDSMRKVDLIHASITSIAPNISHLSQLPVIASALTAIQRGNSEHINALITQAGAAGKNSSRILERMVLISAAVVVFFGITLLLVFVKDSTKEINLDSNGLHITESTSKKVDQKKSENPV